MKCKHWTGKIDYQGCIYFGKKNCSGTDSDCNIIPRPKPVKKFDPHMAFKEYKKSLPPATVKRAERELAMLKKPVKSVERVALEMACQWIADNAPNSGSRGVLLRHFLALAKASIKGEK